MKLLIALHMLKMTVVIVEKLVLRREIKFKVSESGTDDSTMTARISEASFQRPRCYSMSDLNS